MKQMKTSMTVRRPWAALAALAVSLLAALSLAGCASGSVGSTEDEKAAVAATETHLEAFKGISSANADQILWNDLRQWCEEGSIAPDFVGWFSRQYGLDPDSLYVAWLDVYKYRIDSVAVDGDHATVEATVTCRQLVPAVLSAIPASEDELHDFMEEYYAYDEDFQDTDSLNRFLGERILKNIEDAELSAWTVPFDLVRDDGEWKVDTAAESYSGFLNALLGINEADGRWGEILEYQNALKATE